MVYLKTNTPAVNGKSVLVQNVAIPVESGASVGQKTLLLKNSVALPLQDFPTWKTPELGDKCLLIRDKNLCIPVYQNIEMPTAGLIFYASLSEERDSAEIGGTITKYGSTEYSAINGVPCVNFLNRNSYLKSTTIQTDITSFSVSMWVYLPENARNNCSNYPRFFWIGDSKDRPYTFLCGTSTPAPGLNFQTNDNRNTWPASNVLVDLGKWYHVCGVVKNGNRILTYLNGVASEEEMQVDSTIFVSTTNVWFNYFPGDLGLGNVYIAACRIYNRALSESEIQLLANEFTPMEE